MKKKQEDLLNLAMDQLPLRNIMNIATCYGKQVYPQPMAVPLGMSEKVFKGGCYDPVNGFRPLPDEPVSAYPQPMAVPFSESDSPEQRRIKFMLNANSIYGKFGKGKGP